MTRKAKVVEHELEIEGLEPVYLRGSTAKDAVAESCLVALYNHHQCSDDFKEGDEIDVAGVGVFRAESFHIVPTNAEMMKKSRKPYNIRYSAPDGDSNRGFDTLAEAAAYIKERWQGIDYCSSSTNFHTDYAQYYLSGFELWDIGMVVGSGYERDFVFNK
jgi:hypothetical protein